MLKKAKKGTRRATDPTGSHSASVSVVQARSSGPYLGGPRSHEYPAVEKPSNSALPASGGSGGAEFLAPAAPNYQHQSHSAPDRVGVDVDFEAAEGDEFL